MIPPLRTLFRSALLPSLLVAVLAATAGCASADRPARGGRDKPARAPALPTLTARETFFAGRILAEVRVGALAGFDRSGDGAPQEGGDRPRRGGGGMRMGAGPGGMGTGGSPGGEGRGHPPGNEGERPAGGQRPGPRSSTPPVAIHLRFTNTGTTPADLLVADFLSPLGNFVVHPASLRLEPGQALEVEPMASGLAGEVTSFAITLKLRLEGAEEGKSLTLQEAPAPQPPESPR